MNIIIENSFLFRLFLNAAFPLTRALNDLTTCNIKLIKAPYLTFLNA